MVNFSIQYEKMTKKIQYKILNNRTVLNKLKLKTMRTSAGNKVYLKNCDKPEIRGSPDTI